MELYTDEYFMNQAYKEAVKAYEDGEVPIGAIIVAKDRIISRAYNQIEKLNDTTAHAEILAITAASSYLGNKYLKECTMYVTLEPCVMCAGAAKWAQIGRIVYGAEDPKKGFMKYGKDILHPKTKLEFGILSHKCGALITKFFEDKRQLNKALK